jgi:SAM-dependent methyltransferase
MHRDRTQARNTGLRSSAWPVIAAGGMLTGISHLHQQSPKRLRWYRVVYWLAYRLGLTVWQRSAPPADLVALIEGPEPLPLGRALDLGCGTGTDTIYLATRGWDVTAVDTVPQALATARRNATTAGVAPRFIEGDVTRLPDLDIGDGYTLLLDFGCFHTLPEDQRSAYVAGISRAATPGATLLLYGFSQPPKAAPIHAGITTDEVRQRFSPAGWKLVTSDRVTAKTLGIAVPRADDRFELRRYQLRYTPENGSSRTPK